GSIGQAMSNGGTAIANATRETDRITEGGIRQGAQVAGDVVKGERELEAQAEEGLGRLAADFVEQAGALTAQLLGAMGLGVAGNVVQIGAGAGAGLITQTT